MRRSLIVFSHLRWDSEYERPQQLVRRLARYYDIVFVEEPTPADTWQVEVRSVTPDIVVLRPHTPVLDDGRYCTVYAPFMRRALHALLRNHGIHDYGAWFYTPMALPLIQSLTPRTVVYDCMDEFSASLGARPLMVEREVELFRRAQLVFTSGPSLQRAKLERHPRVYCFPSSVDSAHFARAALPRYAQRTGAPQLGYFGRIDERVDLSLVAAIADLRPDWQIHLAGPVVSIPPEELPRRPNIHYTGPQSWDGLPALIREWDVGLVPFALNDATRYASSTKALAYMAAGKPVVSTPIADVVEPYGDLVEIARDPDEFVRHCDAALAETRAQRRRREAAMAAVVARGSWDRTVAEMHKLLDGVWPAARERGVGVIERPRSVIGRAEAF